MKTIASLNVLLLIPGAPASAEDWTQWAGNDRQCNWNETGILDKFPADGLKPTWSVPIGSGYSGPVVWQGRVLVFSLTTHPTATRGEAWEGDGRVTAVLHEPPVYAPESAVRATIVAEPKDKARS